MNKASIVPLQKKFQEIFSNSENTLVAWAPGRVNLLGEHTDYNDGFVFPMAINAGITIIGSLNDSTNVNLYSLDFDVQDTFSLTKITPSKDEKWTNYIRGICAQFQEAGYKPQGLNLAVQGNVPQGAGLSSSAALEVAAALLINELHDWQIKQVELVKLAQKAENEFVGVASGIMDQFASMMGKANHALFLDCRTLDYEQIPTPFEQNGYAVVVINSGVARGLVDSEYNIRRTQCEEAVELLKLDLPRITALRDVQMGDLPLVNALPPLLAQRARHVITENHRVLTGITALKKGELHLFGELLNASHLSLRKDFEVSCPEIDILVNLAQRFPGTLGSRLTGAGFGGSTVSLVPQDRLPLFKKDVITQYQAKTGLQAEFFVFKASAGAQIKARELLQF